MFSIQHNSELTKRARIEDLGGLLGIKGSLWGICSVVAPLAGFPLMEWFGSGAALFCAGALMCVAFSLQHFSPISKIGEIDSTSPKESV